MRGGGAVNAMHSTIADVKNANAVATNMKAKNKNAVATNTAATNAVANNSTATNSPNISALEEKAKKLRAIATLAKMKADSAAQHADEAEKALTEAGGNVGE